MIPLYWTFPFFSIFLIKISFHSLSRFWLSLQEKQGGPSSCVALGQHVKSHWKPQNTDQPDGSCTFLNRSNTSHMSLMVHLPTSNWRGPGPYRGTTITAVCKFLKNTLLCWSLYSPSLLRWGLKHCCATLDIVQDKRAFKHNLSVPSS